MVATRPFLRGCQVEKIVECSVIVVSSELLAMCPEVVSPPPDGPNDPRRTAAHPYTSGFGFGCRFLFETGPRVRISSVAEEAFLQGLWPRTLRI